MAFIIPILKSILFSGILLFYYFLFLRGKKLYSYNRFYLLASVVISLVIPFMSFEWYTVQEDTVRAVTLLQVMNKPDVAEPEINGGQQNFWTPQNICSALYIAVSMVLLVMLIARLTWIIALKRNAKVLIYDGVEIVETDVSSAPFSFLNKIYWKQDVDVHSEDSQLILRHELCHIKQKHTLDKIFMQLVLVAVWINPVFWLIRKELSLQHEFIADDVALEDRDAGSFARMVLRAQYGNIYPDIVHPFFHSSIKRRLMMLSKTKKTGFSFLRRVMVLPLSASLVFLLSFKVVNKEMSISELDERYEMPLNRSGERLTVVFDAGHGGKDNGAKGIDEVLEKDLNLKICRKLRMLADEYNIDARLTRNDDSYPTLTDRTDKTNALHPNLFVSIHVNASAEGEMPAGFELVICDKNTEVEKSRLLASAVSARFASMNIKSPLIQRGVHVLRESNCPAILIECGNIKNEKHLDMLTDNKKLENFCRHILSGIIDYQNNK
jgi:N-acetylmuramoyl-L-alanine amidase